jgi:hypothetical protein
MRATKDRRIELMGAGRRRAHAIRDRKRDCKTGNDTRTRWFYGSRQAENNDFVT